MKWPEAGYLPPTPRIRLGHAEDFLEVGGGDGLDAEALAFLDDEHLPELFVRLELGERDRGRELFDGVHIHHLPARVIRCGLGVVVFRFGIESGVVGVGLAGHFGNADGVGRRGVGVVEEDAVALFHRHHVVAGLVVAYAVPVVGLSGAGEEVVEGKGLGLAFHEPVFFRQGVVLRKNGVSGLFSERLPRGEEGGVPHPAGYFLTAEASTGAFRVLMRRTPIYKPRRP